MEKKIRPLCESPQGNIFCGPDKYLQLQEVTVRQEMFPVMEFDSYFILVREGHGIFIINGEEFTVEPGSVSWIQCSQVLTICPKFGEHLVLWVCDYDYQLLSYFSFRNISPTNELEIVYNSPVIDGDRPEAAEIIHLFEQFWQLSQSKSHGYAIIRSSFLRKIELLYNRAAHNMKTKYRFSSLPLSRRASLYVALHSTSDLSIADVAAEIAPDVGASELNHALLVATGMNFNQYLTRMRLTHAMSYFLYDNLPFDYISAKAGFNKEITFFRQFKAATGMTPQTYLNQMLSDGYKDRVKRGMIMHEILISAISYLYDNMTDSVDAETMAKALFTSENIIRVQFKTQLHCSYKQILSQFRVRYAEMLLTTTALPTVDIAIESGFGSDRTMARVFCSVNGMSPGEFRKTRRLRTAPAAPARKR